jgi:hypothetical protein
MSGTFTDQGWLTCGSTGQSIRMRTVITIENADRHQFEFYFTAPGHGEVLADKNLHANRTLALFLPQTDALWQSNSFKTPPAL